MTFQQARAISKANKLHIRRTSWAADKWFILWRGTWFVFGTGLLKPVRATDYTSADLLATDWTTVPLPLAACPVTPGEPIGGDPPVPGSPGWPGFPDPGFPSTPGSPGGGGGGAPPLPTPETGTSIKVVFDGLQMNSSTHPGFSDFLQGRPPNGPMVAKYTGPNSWQSDPQPGGTYDDSVVFLLNKPFDVFYTLDVTRDGDTLEYRVTLSSNMLAAEGPFITIVPELRKSPISNASTGNIFGGTATVT